MRRIVFISDCSDVAYNELRGTVLKAAEGQNVTIEPVVSVAPFSILNGNFLLRLMADAYPEDTVFSVILNPLKIRPARILGRTKLKDFLFIGANTGVFEWFLRDFGLDELYELHDPGFFPFGGKYVHAPAACKIAQGYPLSQLGKPFPKEQLLKLDIPEGSIVHIDNFGLMKFVSPPFSFQEGQRIEVGVRGLTLEAIWTKRMMSQGTGTWTVYPSSSLDLYELGKVRQNGANEIGAQIGDCLSVRPRQ